MIWQQIFFLQISEISTNTLVSSLFLYFLNFTRLTAHRSRNAVYFENIAFSAYYSNFKQASVQLHVLNVSIVTIIVQKWKLNPLIHLYPLHKRILSEYMIKQLKNFLLNGNIVTYSFNLYIHAKFLVQKLYVIINFLLILQGNKRKFCYSAFYI